MNKTATAAACLIGLAAAAPPARRVPAWFASQQPVWSPDFVLPVGLPAELGGRALRQIVRVGIGGGHARLVFSNVYGRKPMTIEAVELSRSLGGERIEPGTRRPVLFAGRRPVTIAPGGSAVSDPIPENLTVGSVLAVTSIFAPNSILDGFHWEGRSTSFVIAARDAGAARPPVIGTTTVRIGLASVLVDAPSAAGTIVVLGDSITDGAGATLNRDRRWPDFLARRAARRGLAVANAGISGARLLSDGMGAKALDRFERDVVAQPGARAVVIALGINDIAWPGSPFAPRSATPSFEELVDGYRQLAARAHAAGLRVAVATLTPFSGALPGTPLASTYYTTGKDALRRRVNGWIRSSQDFDAVIDFDVLLRDPRHPERLAAPFDCGDHLHPGDVGNKRMAEAVEFRKLLGDVG